MKFTVSLILEPAKNADDLRALHDLREVYAATRDYWDREGDAAFIPFYCSPMPIAKEYVEFLRDALLRARNKAASPTYYHEAAAHSLNRLLDWTTAILAAISRKEDAQ